MGDRLSRRDLLRGRLLPMPEGARGPIVKPGRSLPDVISWLDPEMSATPRGDAHASPFPLLRPPGAIDEPSFLAVCTRCGDCATACPHDVILEAPERLREAHGTPIIDPLVAPCQMCEDLPCLAACETGALRPEAPAALGTASVQALDCLNRLSSSCSVCMERCPVPDAIVFADGVPRVNEPLCTGCGICQHVCPAPNNAIAMLPNLSRPTPAALDALDRHEGATEKEAGIELPELREAALDAAGLRALFGDLEAAARIHGLKLKAAPGVRARSDAVTPQDALALLLAGSVRGVQVRYRYAEQTWCDTILASSDGYRVVRIADPLRPA